MRRFILALLLMLLAAPAWAADTNIYPTTLVDQTCTDTKDTPTAITPGLETIGGRGAVHVPGRFKQLTGSPDNFCDNDSRILTGAITVDTNFGPFSLPSGSSALWMVVDADTVATAGTATWVIKIAATRPFDSVIQVLDFPIDVADPGTGTKQFWWGWDTTLSGGTPTYESDTPIPKEFYFRLDLVAATSFTGEIGMVPLYK